MELFCQVIKLFNPPLVSVTSIALTHLGSADSQWHAMTPIPQLWYPGTTYALQTIVMDNNGNQQQCTTAGKSGWDAPQNWAQNIGGVTHEAGSGAPAWTNIGPAVLTGMTGTNTTGGQGQPNSQFGTFVYDQDSEPARIFSGSRPARYGRASSTCPTLYRFIFWPGTTMWRIRRWYQQRAKPR